MIKSLILKGAIGISNGKLKRNDIEIDFSQFEKTQDSDGSIIALLGDNGTGKSTILQSCHPYRKAYDKNISFKNMFKGGNGEKTIIYELYDPKQKIFQDYKFSIKIENEKQTATVSIFDKNGKEEILNKDEKVKSYDALVTKIFGPADMFFKTYFRNGSDSFLSKLTEGGKKEHFINVLNLKDYGIIKENIIDVKVKECLNEIKEYKKTEDRIKEDINGDTILKFENLVNEKSSKLKKIENEIAEYSKRLDRQKTKIDEYKKNLIKLESKKLSLETEKDNLKLKEEQLENLEKETTNLREKIKLSEDEKNKVEESLKIIIEEKNKLIKLLENSDKIEANVACEKKLKEEQIKLADKEKKLIIKVNNYKNIEREYKNLEEEKIVVNEKISYNKTKTAENCQLCDYIKENKRLTDRLIEIDEELKNEKFKILTTEKNVLDEYESVKKYRSEVNIELTSLKDAENELQKIVKFRENYNKLHFKEENEKISIVRIKEDIEEYTIEIDKVDGKIIDVEQDIENCKRRIKEIEDDISDLSKVEEFDESNLELETKINELVVDKENVQNEWRKNSESLNNLKKLFKQLEECEKQYELWKKDYDEWKLFQDAFDSKKGLPFIELKTACKAIEEITNSLLKHENLEYGLSVEFKTTKETEIRTIDEKDGKSKKKTTEKDVFEINIKRKNGEDVDISKLSNGEKVMVESAISLASVIYMKRNNENMRADQKLISVMFLDEMDGALHKQNVDKFFELIDLAHKKSHSKQTIFITHNDDKIGPYPRILLTEQSPTGYEIIE